MASKEIRLPLGSLGLELEPVLTGGSTDEECRSIGCRVKAWTSSSAVASEVKGELAPGTIISRVDRIEVQKMPFPDIVSLICGSSSRLLSIELPQQAAETGDQSNKSQGALSIIQKTKTGNDAELKCSLPACPNEKSKLIPDDALKDLNTDKGDIANESDLKKSDRAKDGKLIFMNGRMSFQQQELKKTRAVIADLKNDLGSKETILIEMKNDVCRLKKNNRHKDGKITLLSYQLDKSLNAGPKHNKGIEAVSVGTPAEFSAMASDADRIMHSGKWRRVMGSIDGSSRESELHKKLLVQSRVNQRLEAQMFSWMSAQIELQKDLAHRDVEEAVSAMKNDFPDRNARKGGQDSLISDINVPELFKATSNRIISEFPQTIENSFERSAVYANHATASELSSVAESACFTSTFPITTTSIKSSNNIRKRLEDKGSNASAPVDNKENSGSSFSSGNYSNTPIMKKLLHPSKKRAVSASNDDSKPSKMDTSYEFIDNVRSSRSQSEQSQFSTADDCEGLNLSVYPLTSSPSNEVSSNIQLMSPTINKLSEQMKKLRGQNASIRSDLQKFRGMIQVIMITFSSSTVFT